MSKIVRLLLAVLLLLAGGSLQAQTEYNPANPAEPYMKYRVTVGASPSSAGYVSGAGSYASGTVVTLRTSLRNSDYTFSHWTLNGEEYSASATATFTVGDEAAHFVAHYNYTPSSPDEPSTIIENRLYIVPSIEGACSFNRTSGLKVEYDQWVTLTAYANSGFNFLGWYRNGLLVSSSLSFNYQMPAEEVTLTAKFEYNPENPLEPEGDGTQTNVQTAAKGDINKDGSVDMTDVVTIVNIFLGAVDDADIILRSDINGDGSVDMTDVVFVVGVFLNK